MIVDVVVSEYKENYFKVNITKGIVNIDFYV